MQGRRREKEREREREIKRNNKAFSCLEICTSNEMFKRNGPHYYYYYYFGFTNKSQNNHYRPDS